MCKRSEQAATLPAGIERRVLIAAFFGIALAATAWHGSARAGVVTEDMRSAFEAAPAAAPRTATAGADRYQLRCWQHGRLVLEENDVEVPPGGVAPSGAGNVRLRAIDHNRQTLLLTETQNATCLLHPLADSRPRR